MRQFLLGAACLGMTASAASAEWSSITKGPDVFGNTTVLASEGTMRERLIIQCDSKDDLSIAFAYRKKEFERVPTVPATLFIQIDGGQPVKLEAELRAWNDSMGAVASSGKTAANIEVIRAIGGARSKINVGAEINGNQISESFGTGGSRSATTSLIKGCNLDKLVPKS